MDPVRSAAEMIADDAVRRARKDGITSPELVPVDLGDAVIETSEGLTEALVRECIRERWDEVEAAD